LIIADGASQAGRAFLLQQHTIAYKLWEIEDREITRDNAAAAELKEFIYDTEIWPAAVARRVQGAGLSAVTDSVGTMYLRPRAELGATMRLSTFCRLSIRNSTRANPVITKMRKT
jgi:hypothetical protein